MYQMTTSDAKTSTIESSPSAMRASELAQAEPDGDHDLHEIPCDGGPLQSLAEVQGLMLFIVEGGHGVRFCRGDTTQSHAPLMCAQMPKSPMKLAVRMQLAERLGPRSEFVGLNLAARKAIRQDLFC